MPSPGSPGIRELGQLRGGPRVPQCAEEASNGGMATKPAEGLSAGWLKELASQGFSRPVVAVTVANVGRQPVNVARWGLKSGLGTSLYPVAAGIGPSLPHRLEVGDAATWAVDMEAVQAFMKATNETLGDHSSVRDAARASSAKLKRRSGGPRGLMWWHRGASRWAPKAEPRHAPIGEKIRGPHPYRGSSAIDATSCDPGGAPIRLSMGDRHDP